MKTTNRSGLSRGKSILAHERPVSFIPRPTSGTSRRATSLHAVAVDTKDAHKSQITGSNACLPFQSCSQTSRLPNSRTETSLISIRDKVPSQLPLRHVNPLSFEASAKIFSQPGWARTSVQDKEDAGRRYSCGLFDEKDEVQELNSRHMHVHNPFTEGRNPEFFNTPSKAAGHSQNQVHRELEFPSSVANLKNAEEKSQSNVCDDDTLLSCLPEEPRNEAIHDLGVYEGKDIAYWTGRFVAVSDRLRNDTIHDPVPNNSFIHRASLSFSVQFAQENVPFEKTEVQRAILALEILRGYCKSKEAMTSFEIFLTELQKTEKTFQSLRSSKISTNSFLINQPEVVDYLQLRSSMWTPAEAEKFFMQKSANSYQSEPWRITTVSCKPERPYTVSGLKKSQTISNLPVLSSFLTKQGIRINEQHDNHSLHLSMNHETSLTPVNPSEPRTASKGSETLKRAGMRVLSHGSATSAYRNHGRLTMKNITNAGPLEDSSDFSSDGIASRVVCKRKDRTGASKKDSQKSGEASLSSLHDTRDVKQEDQKLVRSTSGVVIRKMMLASVREIRKIGKRVGSLDLDNGEKV